MAKSKQTTQGASVWQPQQAGLSRLFDEGGNLLSSQNPLNAQQLQSQAMRTQYAGGQPLQNIMQGTQGALNFALDPNNAGNNPYLQKAMQSAIRPLTQNYQENVLSGITDQAVQAGQVGSSRQGIAEGIAARGYMDQVGDITNKMAYSDYNAGMDRMGNAVNQAGNVANLGLIPSNIIGQVGAENQNAPWQQLGKYQSLMGRPTVLGGGGSSTGGTSSALGWL